MLSLGFCPKLPYNISYGFGDFSKTSYITEINVVANITALFLSVHLFSENYVNVSGTLAYFPEYFPKLLSTSLTF